MKIMIGQILSFLIVVTMGTYTYVNYSELEKYEVSLLAIIIIGALSSLIFQSLRIKETKAPS
ncbi:hypothetical protein [Caldalkalibacillus mannanilyticus]|uniref:hypothetical protein n=1 Tax=Caldalkalibacillus mannanilyticus TaxID=1418 RepID=UPI00046ADCA2|nr:hypothetical protein [Caldalkalibacillus mannanilyticus]